MSDFHVKIPGVAKVAIINLPDREDRRSQITELMRTERVAFAFSPGVRVQTSEVRPEECSSVDWNNKQGIDRDVYQRGLVGCKRAHQRCLRNAWHEGTGDLLVLEDDAAFRPGWRDYLVEAMESLPAGWLQLYLSAYPFSAPTKVASKLLRLNGAWQTTAIMYSRSGIEAALECLETATCEIDHWFGVKLHPLGHSYLVYPEITYQVSGFSDCRGILRGELH